MFAEFVLSAGLCEMDPRLTPNGVIGNPTNDKHSLIDLYYTPLHGEKLLYLIIKIPF